MKRSSKILVAVLCLLMLLTSIPVFAASAPYETYTYSINGEVLTSPHAYTPDSSITSYEMNLSGSLNSPKDIFVDEKGNGYIYISDKDDNGKERLCNCSGRENR